MRPIALLILITALLTAASARADDAPVSEIQMHLKNHVFVPDHIVVPAGQQVKIMLVNDDATPAEFESYELHREKTVAAGSTIVFFLGPLDAGTYPFYDDFHKATTTGTVIAK